MAPNIEALDLREAALLSHTWNTQAVNTLACYAVEEHAFASGLLDGDQKVLPVANEQLFACRDGGTITGFVHTATGHYEMEHTQCEGGMVLALACPPEDRIMGTELLERAEAYLHQLGCDEIDAFPIKNGYPFAHFGIGTLSDRVGHISAILGASGYVEHEGCFLLEHNLDGIATPTDTASAELVIEHVAGKGTLPDINIWLHIDGEQSGSCQSLSAATYGGPEDLCYTRWIAVRPDYQGRGLGRDLLEKTLWEMRECGYARATLSTHRDNASARLLYHRCGYSTVDTSYAYHKTIAV